MNTLARTQSVPALFDTFFTPAYGLRPHISRYTKALTNGPAINVKNTDTAFQIEVAIPGVKKENFKLNVVQHVLTLSVNQEQNTAENKAEYVQHEFDVPAFERSFRLPKTVNVEAIQAAYTDGILRIELPKMAEPTPAVKHIEVA